MDNYFAKLNAINVNDKTEKKNGLTYLSWAWAWGEVKKLFPDATYTIYERETEYGPVNYFTDGRTCWVKTGVTVNGIEHVEDLPVMDFKNNSILLDKVTSYDVNKAIQRSLTKACARHGLGLYIYAGEDLPEGEDAPEAKAAPAPKKAPAAKKMTPPGAPDYKPFVCTDCGREVQPWIVDGVTKWTSEEVANKAIEKHGVPLCIDCARKRNADNGG